MKSLSIITVTYNAKNTIEKTLNSILEQDSKDFECIWVDGNSNDGTQKILEKYKVDFNKKGIGVKYISEPDKGIYDGMNKGISMSDGKWLNFLNAGDSLRERDTLTSVIEYLKEDVDVLYGNVNTIEGNMEHVFVPPSMEHLTKEIIFCHQATFIKRELLKDGYDIKYKYCADYDFFLELYVEKYMFLHINKVIVNYPFEGQSSQNILKVRNEIYNIRKKRNLIKTPRILYISYWAVRTKIRAAIPDFIIKKWRDINKR